MNRQEFMLTLRKELKKLPPEEIVAATEYFEEYFEEERLKGEKTEEETANELGNPKRIAAEIKADYAAKILDDEYPEQERPSAGKRISAVWWIILGVCSAPVSVSLAVAIGAIGICVFFGLLGAAVGIYGWKRLWMKRATAETSL